MKRNKPAPSPAASPAASAPASAQRVFERPDGFYWRSGDTERGPFETLAEAEADLLSDGVDAGEPGETLQEAESEVGIAEWIDPDTGGPAEDSVPRLEDH